MKKSILLTCFLFSFYNVLASKVQWAKFLKDTTRLINSANYIVQGECTDSLNNIYFCYSKNGIDTNISFITKMSPDGEVLWHKSLFPFALNSQLVTKIDFDYLIHIDSDQHLIIAGALWDTTGFSLNSYYQRKLFYKKWDLNGNQLLEKIITLAPPATNPGANSYLSDTKVTANGDIYLCNYFSDNMNFECQIYGVDKNLDSVFAVKLDILEDSTTYAGSPPLMAITDTAITLTYTKNTNNASSINKVYLLQYSLATADIKWITIRDEYGGYYSKRQIEIFNNHIYLAGNGIEKYTLQGDSVLFNRNQAIGHFVIDTIAGNLYGVCYRGMMTANNINIYKYDTNLNLLNTVSPPNTTGFAKNLASITLKDTVLITHGFTYIGGIDERIISLDIVKADFAGNIIQSGSIIPEIPLMRFEQPKNLLVDNSGDAIIVGIAWLLPLEDTGNVKLYSFPIFAAKLSFDSSFNLSGRIYVDEIANCVIDSFENAIENNLVHLLPEDIYTFSDSSGFYSFKKANGTANIEYIPFINGLNNCVAGSTYTLNVNNNAFIDTLNFGMQTDEVHYDAQCKIYSGISRPGFTQHTNILVQNLSSAHIHHIKTILTIDSLYTFQSSSLPPDSIVNNKLYWSFDSMSIGKIVNIYIELQTTPALPLGYNYQHSVVLTADGDTLLTANNTDTVHGVVIGSFDPNHKLATPEGMGSEHYIDNNTLLDYIIEFQNTGTDTAFTVKLTDDLDPNLDLSTLVIKGSSHKMNYTLHNRKLSFFFNNILLPDSNKDYQKSIGYVAYSVKPKPNILGKKITNKANIYFDFNAPVITNATSHTIGFINNYINLHEDQLIIYPVPLQTEKFEIDINLISSGKASLEIFDISGRKIKTLFDKYTEKGYYHFSIESSLFQANQVYFISLTTANSKKSLKFVK